MPPIAITVPLLNANEPEARLVDVHVKDGQSVEPGAILFTVETTKAASDVEAPAAGFVRIIAAEGDTLAVGDLLAYLTETADESLPTRQQDTVKPALSTPGDLRITKPARALAESLGIDLASLPTDRLLTETLIREFAASLAPLELPDFGDGQILIYGAGGHAKAVMEMVQVIGRHQIAGIVDDNPTLKGKSVKLKTTARIAITPAIFTMVLNSFRHVFRKARKLKRMTEED